MQDDELRELFRQGRAPDRDAAPAFQSVWQRAERSTSSRRYAVIGLAAAAMVVLAAGWVLMRDPVQAAAPIPERIAQTDPVPDLPDDVEPDSAEFAELAAWEPVSFDSPTDFLLDDDGLAGLPSSTIDDQVLDLEDITMEL